MNSSSTRQHLGYISLLVREYDEAKVWYRDVLGFTQIEDTTLSDGKRWLLMAPPGSTETRLLLSKATTPKQLERVGDQAGGRVFLFLNTENLERSWLEMSARGVRFCEQPREETYGTVAVFEDLYGNRWDLQTVAPAWKVRDVAAHLLDTALRKLSLVRDSCYIEAGVIHSPRDLADFVNRLNCEGVAAYRRLSSIVLIELLQIACEQAATFHESLDPFVPAVFAVSWAGEETSLNWFEDKVAGVVEAWYPRIRGAEALANILTGAANPTGKLAVTSRGAMLTFRIRINCSHHLDRFRISVISWRLIRIFSTYSSNLSPRFRSTTTKN